MSTDAPATVTGTSGRFTVTVTAEPDRFGYHQVVTFAEGEQFGDSCATSLRDADPQTFADDYARGLAEARGEA